MKIGILEPSDFSSHAYRELTKIGEVEKFEDGDVVNFIKNKEVLFVRLNYFLGEELLSEAKNIKYICTPTTGLNHIDLGYVKNQQINIISLKGEADFLSDIRATAEHTFGLILSLLRNYKHAFITSANQFDRDKFKGFEIYNNTIGIIGFGRIGKILAKYVSAFGGVCYYIDEKKEVVSNTEAIRLFSMEELIRKSNIICLSASYEGEEIITPEIIDSFENKYFLNVARGELVNETYLIHKIKQNFFKGVAIDVIQNESNENNNLLKFIEIDEKINFILTPHIGGATFTSMIRTEDFIVGKLKKIMHH